MQLSGEAIILSVKKHGEQNLILTLLTQNHGRVRGMVRRPPQPQMGLYQTGNIVDFIWQARLQEHLGYLKIEMKSPTAARFINQPDRLLAMQTAAEWCALALPEQQADANLYRGCWQFWHCLGNDDWLWDLVRWEIFFLQSMGFGLDLRHCALSGVNDNLAFVSPRTGRAVSAQAAGEWASRLLPLPQFLTAQTVPVAVNDNDFMTQAMAGLKLSGYFLEQHILRHQGKTWPYARPLLLRRLRLLQQAA
jgi:DNA repair protein RecO (recombination protein O)